MEVHYERPVLASQNSAHSVTSTGSRHGGLRGRPRRHGGPRGGRHQTSAAEPDAVANADLARSFGLGDAGAVRTTGTVSAPVSHSSSPVPFPEGGDDTAGGVSADGKRSSFHARRRRNSKSQTIKSAEPSPSEHSGSKPESRLLVSSDAGAVQPSEVDADVPPKITVRNSEQRGHHRGRSSGNNSRSVSRQNSASGSSLIASQKDGTWKDDASAADPLPQQPQEGGPAKAADADTVETSHTPVDNANGAGGAQSKKNRRAMRKHKKPSPDNESAHSQQQQQLPKPEQEQEQEQHQPANESEQGRQDSIAPAAADEACIAQPPAGDATASTTSSRRPSPEAGAEEPDAAGNSSEAKPPSNDSTVLSTEAEAVPPSEPLFVSCTSASPTVMHAARPLHEALTAPADIRSSNRSPIKSAFSPATPKKQQAQEQSVTTVTAALVSLAEHPAEATPTATNKDGGAGVDVPSKFIILSSGSSQSEPPTATTSASSYRLLVFAAVAAGALAIAAAIYTRTRK